MNPTQLTEWTEKRNALVAELADAHDKGDHTRWVEAQTKIDNMDAEREKHDQQEQRSVYMQELEKRNKVPTPAAQPAGDPGIEQRNGGRSAADPRASMQYRNDFILFMQDGQRRSVGYVSGPAGGFALAPAALDPVIVTPAGTGSGLRSKIDLQVLTGAMVREGLSITARSGGFVKGRQIDLDNDTEASLTMARRKLTLFPFTTFLKVDNPFIDNAIMNDPLNWIGGQLADLGDENFESYIIYGTGDNEPIGILTADAAGVPSTKHIEQDGASGVMTLKQLVATQYAVKPKWRGGAEWYFSKAGCIMLDSLKDSTGQPILKESMSKDGPVKLLLGSKVNETEAITADFTSATSGVFADNALPGFYGDLKRYQAIQAGTPALKFDRSRLVEKDQTLVISLNWFDGHPIDQEAFGVVKIVN